jgi:hypothetical protein
MNSGIPLLLNTQKMINASDNTQTNKVDIHYEMTFARFQILDK